MDKILTVRLAVKTDFKQWSELWSQYNAFYDRVGETALSEEIVRTTWQRFNNPKEPVHCLVAEYDNELVGLAHYIFHRNTITIENTCYLQDLFSAPEMRGKGVGRALITEFYERAEQAGTIGVYWHTHSSNKTARKFYQKMAIDTGFIVYRKTLL